MASRKPRAGRLDGATVEPEDDRAASAGLAREGFDERGLAHATDPMDEDDQRAFGAEDLVQERALLFASDEARALVVDALADGEGHDVLLLDLCRRVSVHLRSLRRMSTTAMSPIVERDRASMPGSSELNPNAWTTYVPAVAGRQRAASRSMSSTPRQQSVVIPSWSHLIWVY